MHCIYILRGGIVTEVKGILQKCVMVLEEAFWRLKIKKNKSGLWQMKLQILSFEEKALIINQGHVIERHLYLPYSEDLMKYSKLHFRNCTTQHFSSFTPTRNWNSGYHELCCFDCHFSFKNMFLVSLLCFMEAQY